MNQADHYSRYNKMQKYDAFDVLENYFRLFKWRPEGGDRILDVGCGDGCVTYELLLPLLPKNFGELVGCDFSESMIEYARKKYFHDKLLFVKLDVSAYDIPVDYEEAFDHVFSSYCLHWIQNQRQALKNLFTLLKPGGDVLLAFLANNPIFTAYENLAKKPKWANYMQNVNKYVSPFQHSKDPEKEYEELLEEVGFTTHLCRKQRKTYTFLSVDSIKQSLLAVNPFVSKMPEHLKKDYVDDIFEELTKTKEVKMEVNKNNNEHAVQGNYNLLVIFASKPL